MNGTTEKPKRGDLVPCDRERAFRGEPAPGAALQHSEDDQPEPEGGQLRRTLQPRFQLHLLSRDQNEDLDHDLPDEGVAPGEGGITHPRISGPSAIAMPAVAPITL